MLILSSRLENTPVMALQTGSQLAVAGEPVIDPRNLQIVAYHLEANVFSKEKMLLRIAEIRELSRLGYIIDSGEDFILPDDVIKIKEILDLDFHLKGIKVVDKNGKNVGKVVDFTINLATFTIQQLIVKRSLFLRLSDTELTIPTQKIIEITDEKIVIDNEIEEIQTRSKKEDFVPNFTNPFRN